MINDSTLKAVRFYPEVLPFAEVLTLPAAAESSAFLELRDIYRKFKQWVRGGQFRLHNDSNVELRINADDLRLALPCGGFRDFVDERINVLARDYVGARFYNAGGAPITDWRVTGAFVVSQPTVADKLLMLERYPDVFLTPEEVEQVKKYGLDDPVQKGIRPYQMDFDQHNHVVDWEYRGQMVHEITQPRVSDLSTSEVVERIMAKPGEVIILTNIAINPGVQADDITITIDRDDNASYVTLKAFAMNLNPGLNCFIPAAREMQLKITAAGAVASHAYKFTYMTCRISDLMRIRWGMMGQEAPGDLYAKVKGGIV